MCQTLCPVVVCPDLCASEGGGVGGGGKPQRKRPVSADPRPKGMRVSIGFSQDTPMTILVLVILRLLLLLLLLLYGYCCCYCYYYYYYHHHDCFSQDDVVDRFASERPPQPLRSVAGVVDFRNLRPEPEAAIDRRLSIHMLSSL